MVSKVSKLETIKTIKKPESVVNKATEYGALFNKLNIERQNKGLPPLKTAMEILIEAMQSDELDIKDKAKIADKMASYESSRAPVITVDYVQNVNQREEANVDGALEAFMETLSKVK
jgi:hypothetical protein